MYVHVFKMRMHNARTFQKSLCMLWEAAMTTLTGEGTCT